MRLYALAGLLAVLLALVHRRESAAARGVEGAIWRRWTVLALAVVLGAAAIGLAERDLPGSNIGHAAYLLQEVSHRDSWVPMSEAIDYLRGDRPGGTVYREMFFQRQVKFQYPLTSLPLMDLAQRWTGLPWHEIHRALDVLCWASLGLLAAIIIMLLSPLPGDGTGAASAPVDLPMRFALVLATAFLFYPVARALVLGQLQTLVTVCGAAALLAWKLGSKTAAGVLVGLCCAMKPPFALLLPWGLLRREWRFVGAASAVGAIAAVAAVAMYGLTDFVDYFSVLQFLGRHGESYHANQSVNGLVHRALGNGNNLQWLKHDFPPFHPVVYAATLAWTATLALAALFWRFRRSPGVLDLALIMLTATITSPIAWEHHYGIILPIFAVLVAERARANPDLQSWDVLVVIAFFLCAQKLDLVTRRFAETPANFLQSPLLFGGVLLLVLLYRESAAQAGPGSDSTRLSIRIA